VPWQPDELAAALRALDRLAEVPALPGLPSFAERLGDEFSRWQQMAEAPPEDLLPWQRDHLDDLLELEVAAVQAVAGDRLVHLDARGDNMLVRADGEVVLVDWPWAAAGDPLADLVCFVPSAVLAGAGDPEALLLGSATGRDADPRAVNAVLAAFTGLMEHARRKPPPPGIETVRDFQAAQAAVAGEWLCRRTGWA
jgi:aminoglycoside phosphotransferase (APT) family kinase protein